MSTENETVEKLHFRVEGEYITNLSRQLWREGSPVKGYRILESCGLNKEQSLKVMQGEWELVGTNQFSIEDGAGISVNDPKMTAGGDPSIDGLIKFLKGKYTRQFGMIAAREREERVFCGERNEENPKILKNAAMVMGLAENREWRGQKTVPNLRSRVNQMRETLKEYGENLQFLMTPEDFIDFMVTDLTKSFNHDEAVFSQMECNFIHQKREEWDAYIESQKEYNESRKEEKRTEKAKIDREKNLELYRSETETLNREIARLNSIVTSKPFMSEEDIESYKVSYKKKRDLEKLYELLDFPDGVPDISPMMPVTEEPSKSTTNDAYIMPDGKFFPTHYQGHYSLEQELKAAKSEYITKVGDFGMVSWYESGWLKVSSGEISPGSKQTEDGRVIITDEQKESLYLYMTGDTKREKFLYQDDWKTPEEIIESLQNRQDYHNGK